MRNPCLLVAIVLCAVLGVRNPTVVAQAGSAAPAQPSSQVAAPAFVVRANPEWADKINAALAKVAEPIEAEIARDLDAQALVAERCGSSAASRVETEPMSEQSVKIRFAPCLRFVRNARISVERGDTLEGIAVRNGLAPSAASTLQVSPGGTQAFGAIRKTDELHVGDVVVVPQLPLWTDLRAKQGTVTNRNSFVDAIAAAVDCPRENAESCLVRRGVLILERGTSGGGQNAKPSPWGGQGRIGVDGDQPVTTKSISVAPGQWPYDAELLAAILADAAESITYKTVIGIADGGLATPNGSPLPVSVFDAAREELPEPDNQDDDDNQFVDDLVGGGVIRAGELLPSGDVSLCSLAQPTFAKWSAGPLRQASHGAVVASVASALSVRHVRPDVDARLPKIAFFRMLENACQEDASFRVGDGEMVTAFDYLERRSNIVNISYIVESTGSPMFVNAVKATLAYGDKLLVLAAGNDTPGDLDENPVCPPCLGSSEIDTRTANRTLVVGAATRQLVKAPYSNYGERTVGLYAPGEATGALDIAGQDASTVPDATSFAAPFVALAAGIIRSFGVVNALDLRDRLAAATWPRLDVPMKPDRGGAGIVDLVKAAAVKHHAVEVREREADGSVVLRTYVGELLDPIHLLQVCAGQQFFESAYHALRFGDADENGERWVHLYKRNDHVLATGRRKVRTVRCRPQGQVRIRALLKGEKSFPMADVTQILLRWDMS